MDIFQEAASRGIETSFVDASGQIRNASPEVVRFLLDRLSSRETRWIEKAQVTRGQGGIITPARTHADELAWRIESERGVLAEGKLCGGSLTVPKLEHGIYRFCLTDEHGLGEEASLIAAPEKAFSGKFDRAWLLVVQLYSVRSSRNWGVGDFSDLKRILKWVAEIGGAGVGLNPLHALFDEHPEECSPYAPNSRLFLNPLYLDVEQIPECPSGLIQDHAEAINASRAGEFVDYKAVTALKRDALEKAFANFRELGSTARKSDFEAYKTERGFVLRRFACFEVMRRKFRRPWWEWPDEWSRPDDEALGRLSEGPDKFEIDFVQFVQWCAHQQLKSCREMAVQLGMSVGLYLDIAVGVKPDGFDAWNEQGAISRELSIGAPPDILNTGGQNWGLAGFCPAGLQAQGFEPFTEMVRASMHYAGAIRIDHILGLNRLYLIPVGRRADEGTYIRMPLEALLAALALESQRNSCIVIGEDLGTVPEGFRSTLADWNVWSYRVMMFEREHDGAFLRPDQYPENSLATFGTHDLPTYQGWLQSDDLRLKKTIGIDPGETEDARQSARAALAQALQEANGGMPDVYAMLKFLARANSRLLAVSIEDLACVTEQINLPGTTAEYPNWRRRLQITLEDWAETIDCNRLTMAMATRSAGSYCA